MAPQQTSSAPPKHPPATHPGTSPCCTGVTQQLLACKEDQQKLRQQLQASQHDSMSLQVRLDAAVVSKQEAEGLCLHLHEEVQQLQQELTCMSHSASLCQSQQLELQVICFSPQSSLEFSLNLQGLGMHLQARTPVAQVHASLVFASSNFVRTACIAAERRVF